MLDALQDISARTMQSVVFDFFVTEALAAIRVVNHDNVIWLIHMIFEFSTVAHNVVDLGTQRGDNFKECWIDGRMDSMC